MRHDEGCTTIHNMGKCPRPQKSKSNQKEQQIPIFPKFQLDPEQAKALGEAAASFMKSFQAATDRMATEAAKVLNDAAAQLNAMAEKDTVKTDDRLPGIATPEKLRQSVAEFVEAWEGRFCIHGDYGPQAPDLIMEYVRYLTKSDDWRFPEHYAGEFAKTEDERILKHFRQYPGEDAGRVGDIVVAASKDGFGYIGVVIVPQRGKMVEMFTQSPIFPPGLFPVKREAVIGVWRPRVKDTFNRETTFNV